MRKYRTQLTTGGHFTHENPQPILCYGSGIGLFGMTAAFLLFIGGTIVIWSFNMSHQLMAEY